MTDPEEIGTEFNNYVKVLFHESHIDKDINWDHVLTDIPLSVPDEVNTRLEEPYSQEDISLALFEMHPAKA